MGLFVNLTLAIALKFVGCYKAYSDTELDPGKENRLQYKTWLNLNKLQFTECYYLDKNQFS